MTRLFDALNPGGAHKLALGDALAHFAAADKPLPFDENAGAKAAKGGKKGGGGGDKKADKKDAKRPGSKGGKKDGKATPDAGSRDGAATPDTGETPLVVEETFDGRRSGCVQRPSSARARGVVASGARKRWAPFRRCSPWRRK